MANKRGFNTVSNWSYLETDVLECVLKRISLDDKIRISAVCSTWNKAFRSYVSSPFSASLLRVPWLFHLSEHGDNQSEQVRFFSLVEKESYTVKEYEDVGDDEYVFDLWLGSSHGWIVDVEQTMDSYILHPFSHARIRLPLMNTLHKSPIYIYKVILSSDPSHSSCKNFSAAVIYYSFSLNRRSLAFCKYGDETWTQTNNASHNQYIDIICHNGQVYALSAAGTIDVWDFLSPSPIKVVEFRHFPKSLEYLKLFKEKTEYLVESMGEILVVQHGLCWLGEKRFYVSKLDFNEGRCIPLQTLSGQAIFLDSKTAVSVSVQDLSELEENSIYYLETFPGENYLAVYNLEEEKVCRIKHENLKIARGNLILWVIPKICL